MITYIDIYIDIIYVELMIVRPCWNLGWLLFDRPKNLRLGGLLKRLRHAQFLHLLLFHMVQPQMKSFPPAPQIEKAFQDVIQ